MKTLTEQLCQYACYHRHPGNILTHLAGIPLIVSTAAVLLSRPWFEVAHLALSPAVVVALALLVYYVLLDVGFALWMTAFLGLACWFGAWAAAQPTPVWLGIGVGGFVVGWILQFIGHHVEGRKPAFLDDLAGLAIGPLFVLAEVLFRFGLRRDLASAITARAGGLRVGSSDWRPN